MDITHFFLFSFFFGWGLSGSTLSVLANLHVTDTSQTSASLISFCWHPSPLLQQLWEFSASLLHHASCQLCPTVVCASQCTDCHCLTCNNSHKHVQTYTLAPLTQVLHAILHLSTNVWYSCTHFFSSLTFYLLSCFKRTSMWSCRLRTLMSFVLGRVIWFAALALLATSSYFSGKRYGFSDVTSFSIAISISG